MSAVESCDCTSGDRTSLELVADESERDLRQLCAGHLVNLLGTAKVGGVLGSCTVTRFFCDFTSGLLGAINSKFEFFGGKN